MGYKIHSEIRGLHVMEVVNMVSYELCLFAHFCNLSAVNLYIVRTRWTLDSYYVNFRHFSFGMLMHFTANLGST